MEPSCLSGWLRCILVCRFDLDVGQVCEKEIPEGRMSATEKKLCALMAFPDSNIFTGKTEYDACFSFRFKSALTNEYLIGSTFFRQTPDPKNPRGASQKAVVVVCDHDYTFSCLTKQIAYILGPLYFENGDMVLKTGWYLINSEWPNLIDVFGKDAEDQDGHGKNEKLQQRDSKQPNEATEASNRILSITAAGEKEDGHFKRLSNTVSQSSGDVKSARGSGTSSSLYKKTALSSSELPSSAPSAAVSSSGSASSKDRTYDFANVNDGTSSSSSVKSVEGGRGKQKAKDDISKQKTEPSKKSLWMAASDRRESSDTDNPSRKDNRKGKATSTRETGSETSEPSSPCRNYAREPLATSITSTPLTVAPSPLVTVASKPIRSRNSSSCVAKSAPAGVHSYSSRSKDSIGNDMLKSIAADINDYRSMDSNCSTTAPPTANNSLDQSESTPAHKALSPGNLREMQQTLGIDMTSNNPSSPGSEIVTGKDRLSLASADGERMKASNDEENKMLSSILDSGSNSQGDDSFMQVTHTSSCGANIQFSSVLLGNCRKVTLELKLFSQKLYISLVPAEIVARIVYIDPKEIADSTVVDLRKSLKKKSIEATPANSSTNPTTQQRRSSKPSRSPQEAISSLADGLAKVFGGAEGGIEKQAQDKSEDIAEQKADQQEDSDQKQPSATQQDTAKRKIMCLRGVSDTSALRYKKWVFPKWALCPNLSEKSTNGFLEYYMSMTSSPVSIVRTSIIHKKRHKVEQVSPRKHSLLYGSEGAANAPELRTLSSSLDAQAYDGAAMNVWTKLAEFGPEMLWTLWSIAIAGDPLVIYGETPNVVDDAVFALIQLIRPLEFNADYRPHFTVYDPEFRDMKNRNLCVVGCANPAIFMELTRKKSTLQGANAGAIASTVSASANGATANATSDTAASRIASISEKQGKAFRCSPRETGMITNTNPVNRKPKDLHTGTSSSSTAPAAPLKRPVSSLILGAVNEGAGTDAAGEPGSFSRNSKPSMSGSLGKISASHNLAEASRPSVEPGNFSAPKIICSNSLLYTEHSGAIPPDKDLLNRLLPPTSHSAVMINNFTLCQYFYELTCTFLKPFLVYMVANVGVLTEEPGSRPSRKFLQRSGTNASEPGENPDGLRKAQSAVVGSVSDLTPPTLAKASSAKAYTVKFAASAPTERVPGNRSVQTRSTGSDNAQSTKRPAGKGSAQKKSAQQRVLANIDDENSYFSGFGTMLSSFISSMTLGNNEANTSNQSSTTQDYQDKRVFNPYERSKSVPLSKIRENDEGVERDDSGTTRPAIINNSPPCGSSAMEPNSTWSQRPSVGKLQTVSLGTDLIESEGEDRLNSARTDTVSSLLKGGSSPIVNVNRSGNAVGTDAYENKKNSMERETKPGVLQLNDRSRKQLDDLLETNYFCGSHCMAKRSYLHLAGKKDSLSPFSGDGAGKKVSKTLLPAFVAQDFIDNLEPEGIFKTANQVKVRKLYFRFIRSPHFEKWFKKQRDVIVEKSLEKTTSKVFQQS